MVQRHYSQYVVGRDDSPTATRAQTNTRPYLVLVASSIQHNSTEAYSEERVPSRGCGVGMLNLWD